MRCHEARKRLTAQSQRSSETLPHPDSELLEHLSGCERCAELARADKDLNRAFESAVNFGQENSTPLSFLRSRVEASLSDNKVTMENSIMSRIIRKRSGLSVGVAVAILLLAAATLIPFKYDKTVGYEVAVAGVDKNLALDQEKVSQLIAALGIEGATIDVLGCEIKCNMKISELKSQKEADILAAAFQQLEGGQVTIDINTLHDHTVGNFVQKTKSEYNDQFGEHVDPEELHNIVFEKLEILKTVNGEKFNILVYEDSSGEDHWVSQNEEGSEEYIKFLKQLAQQAQDEGGPQLVELREMDADGNITLRKYFVSENGDTTFVDSKAEFGSTENDHSAAKSATGELPESFSLSQNYPNPFNPTTQIEFALPATGHVTLEIINIKGQVVNRLVDQTLGAGSHTVEWNGTNQGGAKVASGVYFYRLQAGDQTDTKKMTLTK